MVVFFSLAWTGKEEGGVVVLDSLPCLSGGRDQDPIFASDFIPLIAVTCLLLRKQDLFTEQSLACSFQCPQGWVLPCCFWYRLRADWLVEAQINLYLGSWPFESALMHFDGILSSLPCTSLALKQQISACVTAGLRPYSLRVRDPD